MGTDTYTLDAKGRQVITKHPDATLDYSIDISDVLTADGDSINAVSATAPGATVNSCGFSGGVITAWVSGGLLHEYVPLTFHWTTNSSPPRQDSRTVYLHILTQ